VKTKPQKPTGLRRFNNYLSIVVFLAGAYLVVTPFLPKVDWWWKTHHNSNPPLVEASIKSKKTNSNTPIPDQNVIVMPSLHQQEVLHEGPTANTLNLGFWRIPGTSTPDKGSNTVIAAHRFTYRPGLPTLYNADKIKVGDEIIIYWNRVKYDYKVSDTSVVPPTQVSILNPSKNPIVTMYTCTPLWTNKSRLVIKADLVR
jgi:LPXTG-site transpeptidase (sortase) family protein